MDKLEMYLDQVCRSIGGPPEMRQHVRQELLEHLLDAVARHQAAGLAAEAALDKALQEFGAPEEVRLELEATHGHRMFAVVIDKAMQWKEMTMKAKWLWTSWAYIALALVIALQVSFISFTVVFLVPKFHKLMSDGLVDPAIVHDAGAGWMFQFINALTNITGGYATWLFLGALAAVGLFEWRVQSENKGFMRLAALGTASVGLMVVVIFMAGSLIILFCLGAPGTAKLARPYAVQQVGNIDTALTALDQAQKKKDWDALENHANHVSAALANLLNTAAAIPALARHVDGPNPNQLREQMAQAYADFSEVREAIREKDADKLKAAVQKFRKAFEPVREAAKKPGP